MFNFKNRLMEENNGEGGDLPGGEAETPSWYYQTPSEDNQGVAGQGETPPEWFKVDKYKSVDEQAKAYNELATRFGGFEAAPKDDYALPEGIDENSLDGGMIDIVKGLGKEYNMSQKMFNDLVSKVNEYQSGQMEQNKQQAMETLGEKAQARISNVNDWLNVNAPKEMVEIIAPMATSAEAIKVLEFFIGKSKGAKVADQSTQPTSKMTQSEYGEMLMAKDNYGNLKISTDRDYKKKMDEMALNLQR
jgi:hypothetical protein